MVKLTIAIPTFNRNELLLQSINKLIPQLTSECKLIVLDNCSPLPVAETLDKSLSLGERKKVNVFRNGVNVGGNANILRCFEYCESEWVWVLGDDDIVVPESISIILSDIQRHSDCIYFSYSFDLFTNSAEGETKGIKEFAETMWFPAIIYISAGIFRMNMLKTNLWVGYQYAYSFAPHVALLFSAFGSETKCFFSRTKLINNEHPLSPNFPASLHLMMSLGIGVLLELDSVAVCRSTFAHKLRAIRFGFTDILRAVAETSITTGDRRNGLYYYSQVVSRLNATMSLYDKMKFTLGFSTLLAPKWTRMVIDFYKQLRSRP